MTSISRDPGSLLTKWIRLAFLLLPFSTVCHSQNTGQLYTFFKQSIGLNDSEIARIEQDKAVAKVLDSSAPSQVFVFGAVFINAQPSESCRICVGTGGGLSSRQRKKGRRDLESSSLRDFVIGEGFWLHPLVSRGFIVGPASSLRTWLTSLESPDSACGLSYRQPRQR